MQEKNISKDNFEQCLKCNLCATVCPMMAANPHYPGPKQAGPDGERYRLKDPKFFDLTLKYCLNCKRCEVACPSGVKVGDIIQKARLAYARQHNPLRDFTLASTDLVGSIAVPFSTIVNPVMASPAVKTLMDSVLSVDKHRSFPKYARNCFTTWMKREAASQQEKFTRFVTYFHGCYVNYNFPSLGQDLVTVMNACNYGVHIPDKERCCGVAMISNGFSAKARRNAMTNLKAFRKTDETILTTSSTCTFTMRDEYENVLGIDTSDVRDRILLATKWLYDKIERGEISLAFKSGYHKKITYHTACHMNKMGWAIYSTELLRMIPGVELTVPGQKCCGIAGTFGFKKENYTYSQKIGQELFDTLKALEPEVVACDCETCKWQIEMSTGLTVMNPISILAEAIDVEATRKLNSR
ncbi:MAG: anaerobic glycerol-3-phosphate dehydrogenase subunit C [Bacteroidales bacterium]|nr:anaerobic glycerol-3-phosphate dehydrogenase subunit C [Bacteroidales bacterium]